VINILGIGHLHKKEQPGNRRRAQDYL
jgi:hypothetical protein